VELDEPVRFQLVTLSGLSPDTACSFSGKIAEAVGWLERWADKLLALGVSCLRQALARRIVLRLDIQLLEEGQSLTVYRGVVTDHPLGEGTDILVLALGNMRNLWVCGLGRPRNFGARKPQR
jgi:hypothetical protein